MAGCLEKEHNTAKQCLDYMMRYSVPAKVIKHKTNHDIKLCLRISSDFFLFSSVKKTQFFIFFWLKTFKVMEKDTYFIQLP